MKKILHILSNNALGGLEQMYINYTNLLQSMPGYSVICMMSHSAKVKNQVSPIIFEGSISSKYGYLNPIAILSIRMIIRKYQINLVICHNARALKLVKIASFGLGIKIIAINHGAKAKRFWLADVVFSVNSTINQEIARLFPHIYALHIPNFTDISLREKKAWGDPIIIGSMARFSKEKGHQHFLDALNILREKNISFKAIIAGDGEEKINIINHIKKLNLGDHVTILDWVEDKAKFYQEIDIFCLHSTHEPFGITILEAMQYGIPVIATDCDGPKDIIVDGINGILCKRENPADIAEKIIYLFNNKNSLQQINLDKYSEKTAFNNIKQGLELCMKESA